MNIKIHNYAEVTIGGGKRRYYNQMLGGLNDRLLSNEDITAYIAFGSGNRQSLSGVTSLALQRGVIKAELCAKNFDAGKGVIFIKKMIELGGEYDGVSIKEIAFTPNADGSGIINYIVCDEQKQEGESLIIAMALYITYSFSGGALCGGENPLFELLLGEKDFSKTEISAVFSDGAACGGKRENINIYGQSSGSVTVGGGYVSLSAPLPAASDYTEALILADGKPCVSFSAEDYYGTQFQQQTDASFENGCCVIEGAGLQSVLSVKSGGTDMDFTYKKIPRSFRGGMKNIFGNIITESDSVFESPCGSYIAVYSGDDLCVYDARTLSKLRFLYTDFDLRQIKDVLIDGGGNVYVRAASISVYKNDNGVLKPCTPLVSFPDNITEYGLCQDTQTYFYYVYGSGLRNIKCVRGQISGLTYNETVISQRQGRLRLFYGRQERTEIVCDTAQKSVTVFPESFALNQNVKELLSDCEKAHICGNSIFICRGGKWRLFDAGSGQEISLYKSGVRRIYVSCGGNVYALFSNNRIAAYYGGCGSLLPISAPQIPPEGKITDVKPLGRCAIVCAKAKSKDCYYMPINFDRAAVTSQGLSGSARLTLLRKSFNNFGGKTARVTLKYI
jgi:hypothetical protein